MGDVVIHAPIQDATVVKTAVDTYAATAKAGGDPTLTATFEAL